MVFIKVCDNLYNAFCVYGGEQPHVKAYIKIDNEL